MPLTMLGQFRELPEGLPDGSTLSDRLPLPPQEKARLLAYMDAATCLAASNASVTDHFTGELIGALLLVSDGAWAWHTDLPYYIDRYDVRLPPDCVERALAGAPPALTTEEVNALLDELEEAAGQQ